MVKVKYSDNGFIRYGLSDGKKNKQGELKVLTLGSKIIYTKSAEVV